MAARLRARASFANVVALLALFVALGGGAFAATNAFVGKDGQVHSCVARDGSVRIVVARKKCAKKQTALAWSKQGPRGLIGPQGIAGQTGKTGPQGPGGRTLVFKEGATDAAAQPQSAPFASLDQLTFQASCWHNTGNDQVTTRLELFSSTNFDVEEYFVNNATSPAFLTTLNTNNAPLVSVTTNPGGQIQAMLAPSIVTVLGSPPKTYDIEVYLLTDGRAASRSCLIEGTATPTA